MAHCESLEPLKYKVTGSIFTTNNNIGSLDSLTAYNVTVRATNNQNLYTDIYIKNTTTRELSKNAIF